MKSGFKDQDLQAMQQFVQSPTEFVKGHSASFGQIGHSNPMGDYAPQGGAIQGILKSMYDSFTYDLEKANAEEADKQKSYEDLMATKKAELTTMKSDLEDEE